MHRTSIGQFLIATVPHSGRMRIIWTYSVVCSIVYSVLVYSV